MPAGFFAALMLGLGGHAALVNPAAGAIFTDAIHVLSAGTWAGGILVLSFLHPPEGWRGEAGRTMLNRFGRVAFLAFAITALTGVLRATEVVREMERGGDEVPAEAKAPKPGAAAGSAPKNVAKSAPKNAPKNVPGSIAGIVLSNPDKVLYPEAGFTKRDCSGLARVLARPHAAVTAARKQHAVRVLEAHGHFEAAAALLVRLRDWTGLEAQIQRHAEGLVAQARA